MPTRSPGQLRLVPPFTVEVVRSAKRRKTISAEHVGGVLRVSIPARCTAAEEEHWVAEMVRRMAARATGPATDLDERARVLASRYGLPVPASVRWVDNQQRRWGSCTPDDGTIRLSSRMLGFPGWVVDYVLVHELAHLVVPGHDAAFHALVDRYPLAERARGFLLAKSDGDADTDEPATG